jgi:acetyl esterase/lipase
MSYLVAAPEFLASAATDLSNIGSALAAADAAAARTAAVLPAAGDEVSTAVASLLAGHGRAFQALFAQGAAFHAQFAETLNTAATAYTAAEAANVALTGGPLIGIGAAEATGIARVVNILATEIFGSPPTLVAATQGAIFTGIPSLSSRISVASLYAIRDFSGLLPPDLATVLGQRVVGPLLSLEYMNSPPQLLTLLLGETVQHTTYNGMDVVQITPAHPSGHYVVALHGGAFALPPTIFHWLNYTLMANQTGATIEVPIYPLIQQGGTAGTVVPLIAGFISTQIAQHGAPNVSVTGDSSGGTLALAAVQYMVANNQTVPASMVLLAPWLDLTMTNPNIAFVNDPYANSLLITPFFGSGQVVAPQWAGNLPLNNPMVSPLYGSLQGLPPTYIYGGALDSNTPDAIVLQQLAAIQGAPISFVFANGQAHDWIYLTPDGFQLLPQIYRELGI